MRRAFSALAMSLVVVVAASCDRIGPVTTAASASRTIAPTAPSLTRDAMAKYGIDIWPSGARPPSRFVLSTSTGTGSNPSSRADFYTWTGSFVRSLNVAGVVDLSSVDGAYVVNLTTGDIWTSSGARVGSIDVFGESAGAPRTRGAFNWAQDGDYFCTLETTGTGIAALLEDVAGHVTHIPLEVPADVIPADGIRAMQIKCSLTADRVLVWGIFGLSERAALIALTDGKPISDLMLSNHYVWATSPDLHWLVAYNTAGTGPYDEVIDATAGSVVDQVDGNYSWFTPDGRNLVGNDTHGVATILDWRTNTELWTGPFQLSGGVQKASDPSTDMMLLDLVTNPQSGVNDYWIVSGEGSGFRFTPQGCASIVASPTRGCFFQ